MTELMIDPEFRDLFPPQTQEEHEQLRESLVKYGFNVDNPIFIWNGYIVDGHNRYALCQELGIEFTTSTLPFDTKEEVIEWMLKWQLGRRNLTIPQRIAITERFRPIFEKQARENHSKAVAESNKNRNNPSVVNLPTMEKENTSRRTSERLAKLAGVSEKTYRKGAKVLAEGSAALKQAYLSGEKSTDKAYQELMHPEKVFKPNVEIDGEVNDESIMQACKETKTITVPKIKDKIAYLKISADSLKSSIDNCLFRPNICDGYEEPVVLKDILEGADKETVISLLKDIEAIVLDTIQKVED